MTDERKDTGRNPWATTTRRGRLKKEKYVICEKDNASVKTQVSEACEEGGEDTVSNGYRQK